MSLMNSLYAIFVIGFILTVLFWFLKKKFYCFICSLLSMIPFLLIGILEGQWMSIVFWSAGILMDVYTYKKDSWDMFGFFDE